VDLKKIKKTKNELELEIIGENETILNPIVHTLLDNEDVEYATCMADHPLDNKRRLFIRVKKGDPNDILKKAIQQLSGEIKKLAKNFDK
jgi:DNA-directed RNA polymerase subunit L